MPVHVGAQTVPELDPMSINLGTVWNSAFEPAFIEHRFELLRQLGCETPDQQSGLLG